MTELLLLYIFMCHGSNAPICAPARFLETHIVEPGKAAPHYDAWARQNLGGMHPKWQHGDEK